MGKPGKKAGAGMLPPTNPKRKLTNNSQSHLRDTRTIRRLKMYTSKVKRDKKGNIVEGSVLSASDKINTSDGNRMARIAPDRRWFGNTRVISQEALQQYKKEALKRYHDPYSVVLKQGKLPLSLLTDANNDYLDQNSNRENSDKHAPFPHIASKDSGIKLNIQYSNTFGDKAKRKRVGFSDKIESLDALKQQCIESQMKYDNTRDTAALISNSNYAGEGNIKIKRKIIRKYIPSTTKPTSTTFNLNLPTDVTNKTEDKTGKVYLTLESEQDVAIGMHHSLFKKGQSSRIWNELYKVIDSADVVLYVLDARNPPGTRSAYIEKYMRTEKKYKHFVFVLNKADLVPAWVTQRWVQLLSQDFPTIPFHASIEHPFGKGNLISLLRQFSRLHNVGEGHRARRKSALSVGVVGYPNVGKSAVINTLRRKKVCKTAPIPGETKVWQYVALTRSIFLIDCPGVVYDKEDNNCVDAVLKGVVRVERLGNSDKARVCAHALGICRRQDIANTYQMAQWVDVEDFLAQLATKRGKLLSGGAPDTDSAARTLLYDWQRGKIPWFTYPPHTEDGPNTHKHAQDTPGGTDDASNIPDKVDSILHTTDKNLVNEIDSMGRFTIINNEIVHTSLLEDNEVLEKEIKEQSELKAHTVKLPDSNNEEDLWNQFLSL